MLRAIGATSIEDLLATIPQEVRLQQPLALPPALRETDVRRLLMGLAEQNADLDHYSSFLGAGSYDHVQPSVVPHLAKRAEFYTSYTPYQPEFSQGVLQATYEFQTMVCQITGMDAANASLYDGSTAVVEAALMAVGPGGRGEVLVSRALDPQYRATLSTYAPRAALPCGRSAWKAALPPPASYAPRSAPIRKRSSSSIRISSARWKMCRQSSRLHMKRRRSSSSRSPSQPRLARCNHLARTARISSPPRA